MIHLIVLEHISIMHDLICHKRLIDLIVSRVLIGLIPNIWHIISLDHYEITRLSQKLSVFHKTRRYFILLETMVFTSLHNDIRKRFLSWYMLLMSLVYPHKYYSLVITSQKISVGWHRRQCCISVMEIVGTLIKSRY